MTVVRALIAVLLFGGLTAAQEHVSFSTLDGWTIHADLYGTGDRGVVLAHGGRFEKSSWEKQAHALVNAGFRVLAIDLRGFGLSKEGPSPRERTSGRHSTSWPQSVTCMRTEQRPFLWSEPAWEATRRRERLVRLLAHGAYGPPEKLKGRKLFIVSRDDVGPGDQPRLLRIRAQYEKAPEPKELVILDGSAHAQFIFQTDQGERLMREILRFLSAP
jgi:pimeloyl-ACP methyl ester carboxylesterase